ncbi:Uncharacterised protein [Mycobacteroides abscessus subsp. abscessus]|nr:Uncharacterised protein [Mycobacteroides abscessus subsp. abscessus]
MIGIVGIDTFMHVNVGWIWLCTCKDMAGNACFGEVACDGIGNAKFKQSFICHN